MTYHRDGCLRGGIAVGSAVVDLEAAGGPVATRAFIALGDGERERCMARAAAMAERGEVAGTRATLRLGPPVGDPGKIVCLGLNYRDHAAEADLPLPETPVLFAKFANSLVGPDDDVVVPAAARAAVDYEAELAVIIGTRASRVPQADALQYVYGYAAFNDVTARDLQFASSQWGAGKAIDTFGPLGPHIVPRSIIPDPQRLTLSTCLNGTVVQRGNTADMIFSVAETVAYISSFLTLEPGDVIATGTPAGVGFVRNPRIALRHGDVVEVTVDCIGSLRNRIVWES